MSPHATDGALALVAITLCLGGLALSSCKTDAPEAEHDAITNGSLELGEDAVGLVRLARGFCTGTLIAPRVVLTAAHCALPKQQVVGTGGLTMGIRLAPEANAVMGFYRGPGNKERNFARMIEHVVVQTVVHPSWDPDWETEHDFDLALLQLNAPEAGVAPVALAPTSPAPTVGTVCKTVGFGASNLGNYGRKQSATMKVQALATHHLITIPVTGVVDHGDSGGPFLCERHIVGVTSNDNSDPGASAAIQRTDIASEWLREQVAALSK